MNFRTTYHFVLSISFLFFSVQSVFSQDTNVPGDIALVRTKKIKFLEKVGGGERAYIRSTDGKGNEDFNSIIFATGSGKESVIFKENGNVGLSTITPKEKLQISNAFTFHDGGHKIIGFNYAPSGSVDLNPSHYAAELRFESVTGKLRLGTSSSLTNIPTTALTINKEAKVGIGTTNPVYTLDVRKEAATNNHEYLLSSFSHKTGKGVFVGYVGNGTNAREGRIRTGGSIDLAVGTTKYTQAIMIKNSSGNVGIGMNNPKAKLEVNGDIALVRTKKIKFLETVGGNDRAYIRSTFGGGNEDTNSIIFATGAGDENVVFGSNGKVGIGTLTPQNELSVNGTIWAKEVKVSLKDAADWVFEADYKLQPLAEVEAFIKRNKHLPEMPSADEFRANDMKVSEMSNKLLQKVEELTLYTIAQEKQLDQQASVNEQLQAANKALTQRLEKLEALLLK
ncbi:hypothetical protein [Aquimarina agarilytica]|uniref:hypothetical protein n=1 Tax=Aquimarina agarilytica TaxID=1087449 RepID=UPI0002895A3F|nr:hypothetical protein [Aquimarina agarilytica]